MVYATAQSEPLPVLGAAAYSVAASHLQLVVIIIIIIIRLSRDISVALLSPFPRKYRIIYAPAIAVITAVTAVLPHF